jgi:type II secretory pathway component PulF
MKIDFSQPIALSHKVKEVDVVLFTRHLATMIKAGIPLIETLQTLLEQSRSTVLKKIIIQVIKDVENGQQLNKALAKHPRVFDQFYTSLIAISEESGSLEENLNFIAQQLAKNYQLKKKIQTASLYPSLVLSSAVIMSGFITLFILPQLVGFFEVIDTELPATTEILLAIAAISRDHGWAIISSLVLLFAVSKLLVKQSKIKMLWHKLKLRLPLVGNFINYAQLARFSRNLGVLTKSGVPITTSLEVTAQTMINVHFKTLIETLHREVQKGKQISQIMDQQGFREFPALVKRMIAVGEKTGNLDEALLYLGDFYEEEIDNASKNLTTVLEPILLLVVGLLVGFVALAIISPIYELTSVIR